MQKILQRLMPFIFLGIALVALAFGLVLFAYLFIIGAFVGVILFLIAWIKRRFFHHSLPVKKNKKGRTFDADDWR